MSDSIGCGLEGFESVPVPVTRCSDWMDLMVGFERKDRSGTPCGECQKNVVCIISSAMVSKTIVTFRVLVRFVCDVTI